MNKWFISLYSASGAAACMAAFLSYGLQDFVSLLILSFIVVFIGSAFLLWIPERKRVTVLFAYAVLLPAFILFNSSTLFQSAFALALPVSRALARPYNLTAPLPEAGSASPLPALIVFTLFVSWFFLAGSISRAARLAACLLGLAAIVTGFYFAAPPPVWTVVVLAAYGLTLCAGSEPGSASAPSRFVFFTALLTGLCLSVLLPASQYNQPAFFSKLQEKLVSLIDPYDPVFHAGNAFSSMMKGADGSQELGQEDSIQFTGRYIASILTPEVKSRLYLRAWTGGVYENNAWKNLPSAEYESISPLFSDNQGEWYDQGAWFMEYMVHNQALADTLNSYLDHPAAISDRRTHFTVTQVYEKTRYYFLPYDADFGAPFFILDRAPESSEEKSYITDRWDVPEGAVVSMVNGPALPNRYYMTYVNAEKAYRDFVYEHYTSVPEGVLGELGQKITIPRARTLSEKREWTRSVQNFLQHNYTYTTSPGRTPPGEDFISYFLNQSHRGYCTAFASAGAMLLRAAGIPARYAVGLTAGPDEINKQSPNEEGLHAFDINDHHAHAWVEVYVDGLGWRPCEMTPGTGGAVNPFPEEESQKRDHEEPVPDEEEKDHQIENALTKNRQPGESEQNQPSPAAPQKPSFPREADHSSQRAVPSAPALHQGRWMMLTVMLAAVILCAVFAVVRRVSAVPDMFNRGLQDPKAFPAVISYLMRLTAWAGYPLDARVLEDLSAPHSLMDRLFTPFRKETVKKRSGFPKGYADWAAAAARDKRFHGLDSLISTLETSRFSGTPLPPEKKASLVQTIMQMRNSCLSGLSRREKVSFLIGWKL